MATVLRAYGRDADQKTVLPSTLLWLKVFYSGMSLAELGSLATMDFVTPARMEVTLQVEKAPARADFRMTQRWLLPIEVLETTTIHRAAIHRGMLFHHSIDRHRDAPVSLRGDRVLTKVGDKIVLALVHRPSALKP